MAEDEAEIVVLRSNEANYSAWLCLQIP
jgi:hypothetical protein